MPRHRSIGIIGRGPLGRQIETLLRTHVSLAPLVREITVVGRTANLDRRRGGTPTVESVMTDRSTDTVIIATPPATHEALAHWALDAGKHVVIEKPAALSASGAREIRVHAALANRSVGIVRQHRDTIGWQEARRKVCGGALGAVHSALVELPLWRSDVYFAHDEARARDQIWNLAYHETDLVRWCLGPVERVDLVAASRTDGPRKALTASLIHASGCLTTISFSTAAFPGRAPRISFNGSAGSLVMESDTAVLEACPDQSTVPPAGLYLHTPAHPAPEHSWLEPYAAQLRRFLLTFDSDAPPMVDASAIDTISILSQISDLLAERA
ncbi:Gfo/Idh/MocA family oxidoreductase [Curtobacterium flaccumfaciens pv. oortii]|uniref:Gfo/Idh/MocA family protein n=1 Tax=Curtobacterium flaccumfaciens TaxID=2035 RepID=UPI00265B653A|nr:Gfo/Idh/MocA family oxidoreductase [Curtobacterium flaccumfaciens]MCS5524742.1 Gfo/Idh/MocA family oxidoreductase [Curtobacterium flaccumfaciens pv. oortii]